MSLIRGIIFSQIVAVLLATETTVLPSMKTDNQLAVLKFEGWGVSEPITEHMTEEFRNTMRRLKIFQVQDRGITEQLDILYPKSKDYWSCWSKECALELGRLLKVNYVIAGNIQNKNDEEYMINARLFSVDMETMANEFALNSRAINDSLLLEMKKMAYKVSGLIVPDTLSVGSDTSQVAILEKNIVRKKWLVLPKLKIPSKVKSLMMSTAIPGTGQIWSKKRYPGFGFMGTESALGLAGLVAYYQYNKSWGGFNETYSSYQEEEDPHELLELRPQIIQYAQATNNYNRFMKNLRYVAASIWAVNMIHAYMVGPDDDYFDAEIFFQEDQFESQTRVDQDKGLDIAGFMRRNIKDRISFSQFGMNGLFLRPIITGGSLSDYSSFFDYGFKIQTPWGFNLGSIRTEFMFEHAKYSFYRNSDNNAIVGSSNSLLTSTDLSPLISIGGQYLSKNMIMGLSSYPDGVGLSFGGDLVLHMKPLPIDFSLLSRANIVNLESTGITGWITLGIDVGLYIK